MPAIIGAFFYLNRQIFDKALIELNKAVELDSKSITAYRNQFILYQNTNQIEKTANDAETIKTPEK